MTKFARSNEVPNVAALTIGVTIHVTRAELEKARTTGQTFALANEKKAEAHDALNRSMSSLAIEIDGARSLFGVVERSNDQQSAEHAEGAPV